MRSVISRSWTAFLALAVGAVLLCPHQSVALGANKAKAKPTSSKAKVTKSAPKYSKYKSINSKRPKSAPVKTAAAARPVARAQSRPVRLRVDGNGEPFLDALPSFSSHLGKNIADSTASNQVIVYTLDAELQKAAARLVDQVRAPHVAIVAMEPQTGRVLAIAERSSTIKDLTTHAGFPAASLFKVVTAAAALEQNRVRPLSAVNFRGGTYTLNQWNYKPDWKKDTRSMTLAEALGRSCNPVFGRIALKHLNPDTLRFYAETFGFNSDLWSDLALPVSTAYIPESDFELSRTAAGFGQVYISPIHAATLIAGVANNGVLPAPHIIDRIVSRDGRLLYQSRSQPFRRVVEPRTAADLMGMLEYTTTVGTSRKEFMHKNRPLLPGIRVAAKTGTLTGSNPPGLNNWFIAAAPIESPKIALAVIVVDPRGISTKASHLGRVLLSEYLRK